MTEHWSLGYLIGLPLWIIVSTALGLVALAFLFWGDSFERMEGFIGVGIMWAIVFAMGLALLWPVADSDYHKYKPYSGIVAEVNQRIVPSGKSVEQKVVVRFDGADQEYGCLDTRCSLAKIGDHLDLSCIKVWEYRTPAGMDCKFVRRQAG